MIKNTEYSITYSVWDKTDGSIVTGDAANHTCKISMDGNALTACTNTTYEIGNGLYKIVLTAAETHCDTLTLVVTSSTPGVIIPPVQMSFDAAVDLPAMSDNITAIKARMPQTGTISTLTARDVWLQDLYSLPESNTIGVCYAHTFMTNIPEQVWGRTIIPLGHTDESYGTEKVQVGAGVILSALAVKNDSTNRVEIFTTNTAIDQAIAYNSDNNSRLQTLQTQLESLNTNQNSLTVSDIWNHTTRTLTSTIPTVSDIQSGLA
ncbi:MAG: hypothetical protein Q4E67_07630, partial [Planctomycetia bacterium]|nr:hypothetical protein [Planctomycetia bacterium]